MGQRFQAHDQRDRDNRALTVGYIRIAAALRPPLIAEAARRGVTFSDEVHRRLALSFGLPAAPARERWRVRSDSGGTVYLRQIAPLVADAAGKNGWSVPDEVNARLEASLAGATN